MPRKKLINKKSFKHIFGRCAICHSNIYAYLDVHRWKIEGKDGGKYTEGNSVVLCANHHRIVHDGLIQIDGIYDSTGGKVIVYRDEEGKEQINFL